MAGEKYLGETGLGAVASGGVVGGENQVGSGQAKEQGLVLVEFSIDGVVVTTFKEL